MISPPSSTGPAAFYFKASRLPMLWAASSYSLGIIFGKYEWRPTSWWFVSMAVFIAAAAYFSSRRSRLAWLLALGSFFLAGALHIQLRASGERLDTTILPYADHQELEVTATSRAMDACTRTTSARLDSPSTSKPSRYELQAEKSSPRIPESG